MSWLSGLGIARGCFSMSRKCRWLAMNIAVVVATWMVALGPQVAFAALSFSGDVSLNTGSTTSPVVVGNMSIGSLQLDNGTVFNSGMLQVGQSPTGVGFATVTGPRTSWKMQSANVGVSGIGRMDVLAGGVAEAPGGLRIAPNLGSIGTVAVDGLGSTFLVGQLLNVGVESGNGLLQISDGGIVSAIQGTTRIGRTSRALLDGGLLRVSSLTNDGLIAGSGELSISQTFTNSASGRIAAGESDHLRIGGSTKALNNNQGLIEIYRGEIEILSPLNNSRLNNLGGEITLENGTLRVGSASQGSLLPFQNNGLLAAIGGLNHVYGGIQNVGRGISSIAEIAITNHSTMIFHDDVSLQGGMMTVFPGSKATLLEDLSIAPGAMLLADIAGSDIDTDYGEIEVVGNISLGGDLQVILSNDFTPAEGDSFQILKALGGIEGSLTLESMPDLPGRLVWDLDVTPNQVLLNVVPAPQGDYNLDGVVDTADYVTWRHGLGQTGAGLAADGNNDGTVDAADYALWSGNYGATAGSSAGSVASAAAAAAVPEPGSVILFVLGAVFALSRKR